MATIGAVESNRVVDGPSNRSFATVDSSPSNAHRAVFPAVEDLGDGAGDPGREVRVRCAQGGGDVGQDRLPARGAACLLERQGQGGALVHRQGPFEADLDERLQQSQLGVLRHDDGVDAGCPARRRGPPSARRRRRGG